MATTISLAARLNEEGAYFFQSGDDISAFAAFKDALGNLSSESVAYTSSSVSAILSTQTSSKEGSSGDAASGNDTPPAKVPIVSPTRSTRDIPRLDEPPISVDDEEPFTFERFLSFDHSQAVDPAATAYCSAIIIFNMAQVFQQRSKDRKTLNKALFLYIVSLRHIKGCTSGRFKSSDVVIAALNNRATVFYHLQHFGKARMVLGELWALIKELRARPESFQKADVDGIVQNILLMLHTPNLAAAA